MQRVNTYVAQVQINYRSIVGILKGGEDSTITQNSRFQSRTVIHTTAIMLMEFAKPMLKILTEIIVFGIHIWNGVVNPDWKPNTSKLLQDNHEQTVETPKRRGSAQVYVQDPRGVQARLRSSDPNTEQTLRVFEVLDSVLGGLPMKCWGLSKDIDALSTRRVIIDEAVPKKTITKLLKNPQFRIRGMTVDTRQPIQLAEGLEEVTYGFYFNQNVILPKGLKRVTFSDKFDKPVILPEGLISVTFGRAFNQRLILPKALEYLYVTGAFCQSLELPPNLIEASLLGGFNSPVKLPPTLKKITFGDNFNQSVILPLGIEEVEFWMKFNRWISLPPSLKSITFGNNFNQSITLPKGLKRAIFGLNFNKRLELPQGLEEVAFGRGAKGYIIPKGCRLVD